jgi:hypothetical protein
VTEVGTNFHPEFGYFSATPRLRREWRVALAAFACGATLGALAIVGVSVSYREADNAFVPGAANERAAGVQTAWKETPPSPRKTETPALRNSTGAPGADERIAMPAERPPQTAHADAESNLYAASHSPQEAAARRITTEPDLLPKPRPIRESLARKQESMPRDDGSAYARSNVYRRTLFWDWSR